MEYIYIFKLTFDTIVRLKFPPQIVKYVMYLFNMVLLLTNSKIILNKTEIRNNKKKQFSWKKYIYSTN